MWLDSEAAVLTETIAATRVYPDYVTLYTSLFMRIKLQISQLEMI